MKKNFFLNRKPKLFQDVKQICSHNFFEAGFKDDVGEEIEYVLPRSNDMYDIVAISTQVCICFFFKLNSQFNKVI